jgi:uncharacterized membrane protein
MNLVMLVLRLLHIVAAIIWGGSAILMSLFIGRGIEATAEAGQRFAQYVTNTLRIHIFITISAVTTILAGGMLYWIDSNGFSSSWMRSSAGIGFGIGAGFGLIAFVSGAIFGSGNARLGQTGAQIQEKPTADQLAQIQVIRKRMKTVSPIHIVSMILAMIFMAAARYLVF